MKPRPLPRLIRISNLLFLGLAALSMVSCASNDELRQRKDSQNDAYMSLQERREIRLDAREERYDARYDRIMH